MGLHSTVRTNRTGRIYFGGKAVFQGLSEPAQSPSGRLYDHVIAGAKGVMEQALKGFESQITATESLATRCDLPHDERRVKFLSGLV